MDNYNIIITENQSKHSKVTFSPKDNEIRFKKSKNLKEDSNDYRNMFKLVEAFIPYIGEYTLRGILLNRNNSILCLLKRANKAIELSGALFIKENDLIEISIKNKEEV